MVKDFEILAFYREKAYGELDVVFLLRAVCAGVNDGVLQK